MSVCNEADALVGGERREEYGPVTTSLDSAASIWSGILKTVVTGPQVALCMAGLKLARESNAHKHDNLVDICGYARLLELYYEEQTTK